MWILEMWQGMLGLRVVIRNLPRDLHIVKISDSFLALPKNSHDFSLLILLAF